MFPKPATIHWFINKFFIEDFLFKILLFKYLKQNLFDNGSHPSLDR